MRTWRIFFCICSAETQNRCQNRYYGILCVEYRNVNGRSCVQSGALRRCMGCKSRGRGARHAWDTARGPAPHSRDCFFPFRLTFSSTLKWRCRAQAGHQNLQQISPKCFAHTPSHDPRFAGRTAFRCKIIHPDGVAPRIRCAPWSRPGSLSSQTWV